MVMVMRRRMRMRMITIIMMMSMMMMLVVVDNSLVPLIRSDEGRFLLALMLEHALLALK
jgi:hypothetical protein